MRLRALLTAALILHCLPAAAETYRVDLIVFLDKYAVDEAGHAPRADRAPAIAVDDAAALGAAGITVLPDAEFGLQEQWNHLRYAARFRPLLRLAWTQRDPPAERGPALRISYGQAVDVFDPLTSTAVMTTEVSGSIALLVSRYLHLDADLRYTQPGGDGHVQYDLDERRRMRRDELHHLDSPKLGILARVVRVDG